MAGTPPKFLVSPTTTHYHFFPNLYHSIEDSQCVQNPSVPVYWCPLFSYLTPFHLPAIIAILSFLNMAGKYGTPPLITPPPPLPWLLQADSNSRMNNNMYFRTSFKYFPIPDFTDFRVFRGFGLCNHLFSVVSSLWEVRLGGAECGFAKTPFQKLRS